MSALLKIVVTLFVGAFVFGTGIQRAHAQTSMLLVEELEYAYDGQANPASWDLTSWAGGDWNRIWFKSEGEVSTQEEIGVEGEAQLLYSRLVSPFWELQLGVRGDLAAEGGDLNGRGFLVVGLEGMAPYWFEVEPAIFVSQKGDVSFRLRATYDLFITQRMIAQTSSEVNIAVQSVPEFGVGSAFNDFQLGLRIRYEFVREFAPYIGINWEQTFAETAELREASGLKSGSLQGVAGLRFWF